ncbi:hypothetical protein MGAD_51640 [Mycolicibacterium gadium]|uniref:Uncharacterized protein n=1 Tax=Mycolicibacterium gadium TaxID=1794 RepID=A0A7I7WT74_MYCGU|nr:hypothetical protein MGAD_51640 [Mycolicibacterium gadium]
MEVSDVSETAEPLLLPFLSRFAKWASSASLSTAKAMPSTIAAAGSVNPLVCSKRRDHCIVVIQNEKSVSLRQQHCGMRTGELYRGSNVLVAPSRAGQALQRRREVVDERQFTVGVTDREQASHGVAADEDPVDVVAGAVDADVVDRRESLGAREVDGPKVEHQLARNPGVLFDEAAEFASVTGVDVADHRDGQA